MAPTKLDTQPDPDLYIAWILPFLNTFSRFNAPYFKTYERPRLPEGIRILLKRIEEDESIL